MKERNGEVKPAPEKRRKVLFIAGAGFTLASPSS